MGETLTTVIVIFLAAVLMLVFPMQAISDKNDEMAQLTAQSAVTETVKNVSATGILTNDDIEKLEAKLITTGNTYDIDIEIRISDKNPGKKTNSQQIGDTTYYSLYTDQVMAELNAGHRINLKQGDFIKITVKNSNTTISQMFKNLLYGLTGNEAYVITAQDSTSIVATGTAIN